MSMQQVIQGKAYVLGDNVDTDQIIPAQYLTFNPSIPEEYKQLDALTRTQKMGRIMACADGWFFPFSRTVHKNEPPGIDIEILQSIAKKQGWEVDISWVNMATRFGPGSPGGAYSRSIDRGICDIVTGLAETGDDHHMPGHKLVFSQPYMSTGFVLVTQGSAKGLRTLDEVKAQHVRIGVPAYSPMHEYVQANGFEFVTFFQNYQVIDALIRHEVEAAMIWSGATVYGSCPSTTRSASLPGWIDPRTFSWNTRNAFLRVCAIRASSRLMVCRMTLVPPAILPVTAKYNVVKGRV
jgi:hypothetical protein